MCCNHGGYIEEGNDMRWVLVILLLMIFSCMIPPYDYYMINFETHKSPQIRLRMPCWIGEASRYIWEDVQTWDEYIANKRLKEK